MTLLLTFLVSAVLSLLAMPIVTAIATSKGWFDSVGERKIHVGQIPRLGGVGIAISFYLAFPIAKAIIDSIHPGRVVLDWHLFSLLGLGLGFFGLGLLDDFRSLRAKTKFAVQLAMALGIIASGFYCRVVEIPLSPFLIELGVFGPILTLVWIVGITNAVNLIDGMDGLASGITFIGAITWALLYLKTGQSIPALVALSCAGAILGFLFFNFPPASIFMGDSGSLFLGFMMAILPLIGRSGTAMETGLVPAITICLIPILDTFAAILRRWRRGVSFFTPDKFHLHHKLLNLGFSARQILAIIYCLCVLLGFGVLVGVYVSPVLSFWLMMGGWGLWGAIFVLLHLLKEKKVRFFAPRGKG